MNRVRVVPILALVFMFLIGAGLYNYLPAEIPTHWNAYGEIDAWSPKNFWSVFMPPLITVVIYLFFLIIPLIDPLRKNFKKFEKTYHFIVDLVLLFFAGIYFFILIAALNKAVRVDTAINISVALLIILLGNRLGQIKKNYFVGFRTPWTLASEKVWVKTHRFAAKLFVVAGFIMLIGAFLKPPLNAVVLLVSLLGVVLIGTIYSYLVFNQLERKGELTDKI